MTTLDTLAVAINAEHIAALGASRTALDHAHRAGDLLLQARAQLLHGQWLPWLAEHCNFSFRNAQVYMRIARLWPRLDEQRNAHPNTHLDITAARQLLAGTGAADDDDVGDDDDGVGDDEDDVTDDDITGDDLAGGGCGGGGGSEQRQMLYLFFTVSDLAAFRADVRALAAHLGIVADNEADLIRAVMAAARGALIRRVA